MTAPSDPEENDSSRPPSNEQQAISLQNSVAPDLYTTETFIPWDLIDHILGWYGESVDALQQLVDNRGLTRKGLAEWLTIPHSLWVARALLAAPQPVGFADGRQLPDVVPQGSGDRLRLAGLLIDLGMSQLLPAGTRVLDVVRVGEIGLDARRRGFRRRDTVKKSLNSLVQRAAAEASLITGRSFERLPTGLWPAAARNRATAVVGVDGVPVVAVVSVFQAQTGGRQTRDLLETYPALQRDLDSDSVFLVVLADGRGIKQSPRRVLRTLIEQVAACMSTRDAEAGLLTDVLIDAAQRSGLRRGAARGLEQLIASALASADSVVANDLPGSRDQALVALGDYVSSHPELALRLDASEGTLTWSHPEALVKPREMLFDFRPETAIRSLATMLDLSDVNWLSKDDEIVGAFGSLNDPVLPPRMLVAAADPATKMVDLDFLRKVGRLNRTRDDGGRLALLVTPPGTLSTVTAAEQRMLATSVVVVDAPTLAQAAEHKIPRGVLLDLVLRQADLTKANPFNVMGVAGSSVFYGRGHEDSMLQNTLRTNSAALIGGRRIGKTSLLQHARARLTDAGFNVQYADCQAIDSWQALAAHAALHWQVHASDTFSANAVEEMVAQLQTGHHGPLVVMLDEVDNLLRWDRSSVFGGMDEPLFRTLRSLSQEGSAQFVFSGERLIANVLWDPSSPHWNFCRSIPVRQLTREDALALFANPIRALGVHFADETSALTEVWQATSGHPQIVQQLGELVVSTLNDRPSDKRAELKTTDVAGIAASVEFRRHYVHTYWGQATTLERLVTALVAEGCTTIDEIMDRCVELSIPVPLHKLETGLRMLDLYGILVESESGLGWRAQGFPTALEALGGPRLIIEDCVRALLTETLG